MSQRLRFQDAVPARNPSRRSLHEKQRSRRRVENIGDGLLLGHDTQPAINVAASSKQRVSRNGLASPGGRDTQKSQAAANSVSLLNSAYAQATESFEARIGVPPVERPSSRNFARPVGGLSFRSRQTLGNARFGTDCGLWPHTAACRSAAHGARGQRTARFVVASAQLISCSCCGTAHFNLRAAGSDVRFSHRAADCILQTLTFLNPVGRRRIGLADHFRELLPCSSMWS